MAFRKPITTLGGTTFWENIRQNERFIMQKHTTGLWPYSYRILMRENRMEIANSNDRSEINQDWRYLENNVVPQVDQAIDAGKPVKSIIENADQVILAVAKLLVKLS